MRAAGLVDTDTFEPAAEWLALRLHEERDELVERWRQEVPGRERSMPELIEAVAEYLCRPAEADPAANTRIRHQAEELGVRYFEQAATLPEVLHEYHALADLLEEFALDQLRHAEPPFAGDQVVRAKRCVTQSVRVLEQQSVGAFVQKYIETIERQSERLLAFGRLVGHEMRQPLGVLQLMPGVVPIREGDLELTRLLDVFARNVRRLTDVAGRLERLSHRGLDAMIVTSGQTVDLGAMAADVVEKLRDLTRAHDVRVQLDPDLPTLTTDSARTEMVLLSLIANGIKHSDSTKTTRLVEVLRVRDQAQPTIIVRDNGVGIPQRQVRHFFREFARAHGHRDGEIGHQGLGVGLSIVRSSMDACGGTVLLQSTEGVGTTVTLSWPQRANGRNRR